MKIKMLMTKTITSFSDEIKFSDTIRPAKDSNDENKPSFYDSIKSDLDQQLIEPSADSVRSILNYSIKQKQL